MGWEPTHPNDKFKRYNPPTPQSEFDRNERMSMNELNFLQYQLSANIFIKKILRRMINLRE